MDGNVLANRTRPDCPDKSKSVEDTVRPVVDCTVEMLIQFENQTAKAFFPNVTRGPGGEKGGRGGHRRGDSSEEDSSSSEEDSSSSEEEDNDVEIVNPEAPEALADASEGNDDRPTYKRRNNKGRKGGKGH